jgi:hypothetical protein
MKKIRSDIRMRITLPPDIASWLTSAPHLSSASMTRDQLIIQALRYYADQPEDALDYTGLRVCCGTGPLHGHRGTCRYSAMRGGPGSAEYQALQRMWQESPEAGS